MILKEQVVSEATQALAKVSPPIVVAAASGSGLTLQEWTYVATILYVLLQAAFLAWKWYRTWRAGKVPA